jgi:hypothetical protein
MTILETLMLILGAFLICYILDRVGRSVGRWFREQLKWRF